MTSSCILTNNGGGGGHTATHHHSILDFGVVHDALLNLAHLRDTMQRVRKEASARVGCKGMQGRTRGLASGHSADDRTCTRADVQGGWARLRLLGIAQGGEAVGSEQLQHPHACTRSTTLRVSGTKGGSGRPSHDTVH